MAIRNEIRALAVKYAYELKARVEERVADMKSDDTSHYLIYKVLGITDQEGEFIDVYSKGVDFKFNTILTDYSPTTNVDQILQRRSRDKSNKSVYQRDENGEVVYGGKKPDVPLSDVWEIPFLNPKAKEKTGYPTQKPIMLLEQIISLSTDEGDTVLDPFCGSGTTLVAAHLMKRYSVGIDISKEAVDLTRNRLAEPVKTESKLVKNGLDSYKNANNDALALLRGVRYIPVQRNNGIDAFLNETYYGVPIPVRVQRQGETVADAAYALHRAARTKKARRMILIATHDQPLLFPTKIPEQVTVIPAVVLSISRFIKSLRDEERRSVKAMHSE